MTPGNNGASTPEDDDPFGYLYADGQAAGATPPDGGGGYGYPGSVNRVRAVGERQYGQQAQQASQPAPTAQYAQAPAQQGQGTYGQSHYQAPEMFPGGAPTTRTPLPGSGGGGRGRGPNTKGLLIGAIAVVAAVVIGIGIAMLGGDEDPGGNDAAGATPTAEQNTEPSESASKPAQDEDVKLPEIDAKTLKLGGSAQVASDVDGSRAEGGTYVAGLNAVGSTVTWTVNDIPEEGLYTLFAGYSVASKDRQEMTLIVNGKPFGSKLNMSNFAGAKDFENGWQKTYAWPTLNKGTNTISLACQAGDKCDVLLDQLWLKKGQVKD